MPDAPKYRSAAKRARDLWRQEQHRRRQHAVSKASAFGPRPPSTPPPAPLPASPPPSATSAEDYAEARTAEFMVWFDRRIREAQPQPPPPRPSATPGHARARSRSPAPTTTGRQERQRQHKAMPRQPGPKSGQLLRDLSVGMGVAERLAQAEALAAFWAARADLLRTQEAPDEAPRTVQPGVEVAAPSSTQQSASSSSSQRVASITAKKEEQDA